MATKDAPMVTPRERATTLSLEPSPHGASSMERRGRQMYEATLASYRRSLDQHMPECAFRSFADWGSTPGHAEHELFAQINGVSQLARMTTLLLSPATPTDREWSQVAPAAALMNAWQTHEVYSDNLALGLGLPPTLDDEAMAGRRELLRRFNHEIVRYLDLCPRATRAQLHGVLSGFDSEVSLFEQSLGVDKHQRLARAFAAVRPELDERALEHDYAAVLTANVMSAGEVMDAIDHPALRVLVRRWLRHRYRSVDAMMQGWDFYELDLLEHGGRTILVAPTLGYYVFAVADALGLRSRLTPELVYGPLEEALRSAAILVRLLNDLGTSLMTETTDQRRRELEALSETLLYRDPRDTRLVDALARLESASFTRLAKDARFREINLGFYGFGHRELSPALVGELTLRIDSFARAYEDHRRAMAENLSLLTAQLGDSRCASMVDAFVSFHEELYGHHYHQGAGEYAV